MSRDPNEFPSPPQGPQSGAQGASRGGASPNESGFDPDALRNRRYDIPGGDDTAPLGGYPFGGQQSGGGGRRSFPRGGARFLGLPVKLIYAIGAAILGLVFITAFCGGPTATGAVAGQVQGYNADGTLSPISGAPLTLRGSGQTYTATSTEVTPGAEGEAAFNYRFADVPPGTYALSVAPPAGSTYQPEGDISFKVKSGQVFPQSVMLLEQGIQRPRQLSESELQAGESGGYVNGKGERVVYQQGSGFNSSDAMLMYLLWRNPAGWGYGAPPVIVNSPSGTSTGSNYRVAEPPSKSSSGQTITQQKPTTAGQGSTRPSSSTGVSGSGPNTSSSGSSGSGTSSGSSGSGSSSSGANTSTQTKPSTSTGGSTVTRPSAPSQGITRPSSSSRPSFSIPSRSSGGGRR